MQNSKEMGIMSSACNS